MDLKINLENNQTHTSIQLDGDINTTTILGLENALLHAVKLSNKKIVLDCTLLNSISGEGLKMFLSFYTRTAGHFRLSFYNVPDNIASLIELSGITYFMGMKTQSQNQTYS